MRSAAGTPGVRPLGATRTPGLRGEREKVKPGVATPRDLQECGWRGWRGVGKASCERAGSQSQEEEEVEEASCLEEVQE